MQIFQTKQANDNFEHCLLSFTDFFHQLSIQRCKAEARFFKFGIGTTDSWQLLKIFDQTNHNVSITNYFNYSQSFYPYCSGRKAGNNAGNCIFFLAFQLTVLEWYCQPEILTSWDGIKTRRGTRAPLHQLHINQPFTFGQCLYSRDPIMRGSFEDGAIEQIFYVY